VYFIESEDSDVDDFKSILAVKREKALDKTNPGGMLVYRCIISIYRRRFFFLIYEHNWLNNLIESVEYLRLGGQWPSADWRL